MQTIIQIALVLFFGSALALLFCISALALAFALRRQRPSNSLLSSSAAALVVLVSTWLWPVRPLYLRGKQVRTWANLQSVSARLDAYFNQYHRYPANLEMIVRGDDLDLLRDAWGNRISYDRRGTAFVLVSVGSDGKQDREEYWTARSQFAGNPTWLAGRWSADQVITDRGTLASAGK